MIAADAWTEPPSEPLQCPRCGLVLDDELRAVMQYCAVCQRGDLDAGLNVPEHIDREGDRR